MRAKTICLFHLFRILVFFYTAFLYLEVQAFARDFVAFPKAKIVTKFPFFLTSRGMVIIKGQFGHFKDTLNFLLDTGSGGISLDSSRAVQFNQKPVSNGDTIKGISQKKPGQFLLNQQLRLTHLTIDNLDFHINNYAFLSQAHDIKIDGVIGYSFLKLYIVKLNYDKRTIEVWSPGSIIYPKGGYVLSTTAKSLAAIDATVDDNQKIETRFYFDTGADIPLLLCEKFIKDSNVLKMDKKPVLAGAEGLGGKKEMLLTTIKNVQIGPYSIKNVPAYIFNDPYNVSNYPVTGGIIGNELLQRFNLVINYPASQIHLAANSMFNAPFNYAYVGCTIASYNGKTIVKDLVEGSPAHKAGLKNDDVIFGINNNFKNDLDEYRNLFYKTGSKLKVFLLRDNQIQSTVVEVKSFL